MREFSIVGSPLFIDLSQDQIEELLETFKHTVLNFEKGEIIVCQGDVCKHLYILAIGSVKTEMFTEEGGNLAIANIQAPNPLASAFLFADNNRFPVDVIAETEVAIIRFPKEEVIKMFSKYPEFLSRYISFNSNITQFLSSKLHLFTIKTIKGKISHYLLGLAAQSAQKNGRITVKADKNQTELAKLFGVARPSLSRTLSEMEQEGIISVNRSEFVIENLDALKKSI